MKLNKEFWFDLSALFLLWVVIWFTPDELLIYESISFLNILKIIALISTLEVMGFFAHHLMGNRAGVLLQGFLGGFVSSTMTFLNLTQDDKGIHPVTVSRALLLATVGMLVECTFIIFAILPENFLALSKPFLVQIILLILFAFLLGQIFKDKNFSNPKIVLDDPIVWKKVAKFAVFILGLIFLMRFLSTNLKLPHIWASFILSLFEAHGVLTAGLTEAKSNADLDPMDIVLAVLIGNFVSKTFLVLRGKKKVRMPVLIPLSLSLLGAWSSIYI